MNTIPGTAPPPAPGARLRGQPSAPVIAMALGLATCVAVNLVDPNVDGALGWCPFKLATGGLDCPGCGVLRATRSLTRGDLLGALDHNVLWTVLMPLVTYGLLGWWRYERGLRPRRPVAPRLLVTTLAVVTAVFWLVRNLPTFQWLASGAG